MSLWNSCVESNRRVYFGRLVSYYCCQCLQPCLHSGTCLVVHSSESHKLLLILCSAPSSISNCYTDFVYCLLNVHSHWPILLCTWVGMELSHVAVSNGHLSWDLWIYQAYPTGYSCFESPVQRHVTLLNSSCCRQMACESPLLWCWNSCAPSQIWTWHQCFHFDLEMNLLTFLNCGPFACDPCQISPLQN